MLYRLPAICIISVLFLVPGTVNANDEKETGRLEAGRSTCNHDAEENEEWLDITHRYINESMCIPAEWVDSFFSTERLDEEVRPGSYVRWINDFVQTEGGQYNYVTKIRANLRLPKATKKLKLIIEGEQEESVDDVISVNEDDVKTNVGLLYELLQSQRSNLNLKLNLSPKIALRYRYTYPFSEYFLSRFTQDYFKSDDDGGSESRLDLENRFNDRFLLRWSNIYQDTELIDGIQWTYSLVLYQRLSDVNALSYESSVSVLTEPEWFHSNERLAIRYRQSFYRKWLFYELVPEITWPKVLPTDQRQQVALFTFRLEIKFNSISD